VEGRISSVPKPFCRSRTSSLLSRPWEHPYSFFSLSLTVRGAHDPWICFRIAQIRHGQRPR
jgi:hypothetical protein